MYIENGHMPYSSDQRNGVKLLLQCKSCDLCFYNYVSSIWSRYKWQYGV